MTIGPVFRALAVAVSLLVITNIVFVATFPRFGRLRYNFSSAYLAREIREARGSRPVLVLGDSVLWGYGIPESQTAVALVRARRRDWVNCAFAGGSPINSLALLELLLRSGVRPRYVVFNVNEKTFNPEDSAYEKLHPAVEELALAALPQDARRLVVTTLAATGDAGIDRALSRYWALYGMRADLRDALFGDADAAHAVAHLASELSGSAATIARDHVPTSDKFEGTYDLTPLGVDNTEYVALADLANLLRAEDIPGVAVLTPTNHRLLHDYIDVPAYRANLARVRSALAGAGTRVLDLDAAFRPSEFIDNDHLDAAGNARLASIFERALPQ